MLGALKIFTSQEMLINSNFFNISFLKILLIIFKARNFFSISYNIQITFFKRNEEIRKLSDTIFFHF